MLFRPPDEDLGVRPGSDVGEKDKKLKLLAPPFKALGAWGSIRRGWNGAFCKPASAADGTASFAEHAPEATGGAR